MSRSRIFVFALFALLLAGDAFAATPFESDVVKPLAGRNVLLLVGPDQAVKAQKATYLDLLKRSGADLSRYPVYHASSLQPAVAAKLGLGKRAPAYAALVRWGNPARFGPARILEPGVITELATEADMFVLVESAMAAAGQQALLEKLPGELSALRPRAQLTIEQVDFEANGKPVFIVNTKVRIKNSGKRAAKGVNVIYLVENAADGSWFELGRQSNLEVKAGDTISRDLVRPTYDTPLLNARNEIQPTKYRIRVESPEGSFESTEQFTPMLIQNQPSK